MFSIFNQPTTQQIIKSATEIIPRTMGDVLVSLILYGEALSAGQDSHPRSPNAGPGSSIQILIALRQLDPATLERLAEGYREIRGRRHLSPMVLTVDELHASTDVFPITFLEMKRHHRLLYGKDILDDLPIRNTHLRLRCEQELKNLLLRMQNRYLTQHDSRRLKETFHSNVRSFVRTLGAAILLLDRDVPDSDSEVIQIAAEGFGFDSQPGQRILECYDGQLQVSGESLLAVYAVFIDLVSQAATALDRMPEQVSEIEIISETEGE